MFFWYVWLIVKGDQSFTRISCKSWWCTVQATYFDPFVNYWTQPMFWILIILELRKLVGLMRMFQKSVICHIDLGFLNICDMSYGLWDKATKTHLPQKPISTISYKQSVMLDAIHLVPNVRCNRRNRLRPTYKTPWEYILKTFNFIEPFSL